MTNYNIARLPSRFRDKININPKTSCWLWTAALFRKGYGVYQLHWNKTGSAHRFAWEFFNGPIPPHLQVDHICRIRNCVNPEHMELVTQFVNSYLGNSWKHKAQLTHCKHGHPLSGSNVYWRKRGDKWRRHCRACQREANWRYRCRGY